MGPTLVRLPCAYMCVYLFAWLLYCQFQMSIFTWMHSFEIYSMWCIHDPCYLSENEGEGFCQTVVSVCEDQQETQLKLQFNYTRGNFSFLNYTMHEKAGCSVSHSRQKVEITSVTMNNVQNLLHDLSVNFSAYLCSCPDWQTLLVSNDVCMHGLCAMTNDETNGVLLAQACSMMIKHLPTIALCFASTLPVLR